MADKQSPANEIEADLEQTRLASIAELEREIQNLESQIGAEDPREQEYRALVEKGETEYNRLVKEAQSMRKLIDESLNTKRKKQMLEELSRKKEKLQLLRDYTHVVVRTPQASSGGC